MVKECTRFLTGTPGVIMINSQTAVVFPGQGSQSVGMLHDIASAFPSIQLTFERASTVLGYDLWSIVARGPAPQLDQTAITQPALLTASYALWELYISSNQQPAYLAGHSLGEYTALVCANALAFEDAVKLVAARGEYMQAAVQPGVGLMAAIIGLDNDIVNQLCDDAKINHDEVVAPANYNSLGQVVIAGHKDAVERAITLAKSAGAKLVSVLPVSVPSHCALMQPAADRLALLLNQIPFSTPTIPTISNAEVKLYQHADDIRHGLVKQLYCPVRWVETVQFIIQADVTTLIECGPGKVLTGLAKRMTKSLQLNTLSNLETLNRLTSSVAERKVHE
jgi:[acyl-carrier-protein] S-malonyltransferase